MESSADGAPHPAAAPSGVLPVVELGSLQPFVSVLILEPSAGDAAEVFAESVTFLREPASSRMRARVILVAEGLDEPVRSDALVDATAMVHRVERSPSWQVPGSAFGDVQHALTVVARSEDLVAVLTDALWADRLQRWLDGPSRAGSRVPDDVLQYAFLRGEANGLWLRGAHTPRTTKPDSKMSAGRRLQDSLDPITDGTYSLASGRALVVPDIERTALRGSVGTTPRRGLVWCRKAGSMTEFADVLGDLFAEVRHARTIPAADRGVFTQLTERVADLSTVHAAFEVGFSGFDVTPQVDLDDDALREAADLVERASFAVQGHDSDPSFLLDVELDGRPVGVVHGAIEEHGRRRELVLNLFGVPADPPAALAVMGALRRHQDLITVYYRSQHAYVHGEVVVSRIRPTRFPGWEWHSFEGYRVTAEKPAGKVHEVVGGEADDSLFGWVVRRYRDGWLTCDDGSGEVADFVHLTPSGLLRLIHVKAARGRGARGVSAAAYEVVVGQAVKNLTLLDDLDVLLRRLGRAGAQGFATWNEGRRASRAEFLAALRGRSPEQETEVVILQPHVPQKAYRAALTADHSDDQLRLYLLESLLNGASSSVVARGARLTVVGDAG